MLGKNCLVKKLLEERCKTGEGDEEDVSSYGMILRKLEGTGS
jgi:hypothetical protein